MSFLILARCWRSSSDEGLKHTLHVAHIHKTHTLNTLNTHSHTQLQDAKSMINIIISSIRPTIYIIMNFHKAHQQSLLAQQQALLAQTQLPVRICAYRCVCFILIMNCHIYIYHELQHTNSSLPTAPASLRFLTCAAHK